MKLGKSRPGASGAQEGGAGRKKTTSFTGGKTKIVGKSPKFSFRLPKVKLEYSQEPTQPSPLFQLWQGLTAKPSFDYHMLWYMVVALSGIGLVMQFSASTIIDLSAGINPYWGVVKPLGITIVGFSLMVFASKISPAFYHRWALLIFILAVGLQLLVMTPLGKTQNGNRNWIVVPFTNQVIQPSEFLKIALIILLTTFLAYGKCKLDNLASIIGWIGVPFVAVIVSVILGHDLGTALIFVSITFVMLWVGGLAVKYVFMGMGLLLLGLVIEIITDPSRLRRLGSFLNSYEADPQGAGLQVKHSLWALGTGGLSGVGPGASRQKWNYLPEAQTDFIYAILGEEFGFIGTLTVIIIYAVLGWILLRLIMKAKNFSTRFCASGVVAWIMVQSLVNVAVVIGIAPVVGLPLPLISSGGSAQLATLIMMGVLLAFVKAEPGVKEIVEAKVKNSSSVIQLRGRKTK